MKKRVAGIEPALEAWEASVIPLHYTRKHGVSIMAKRGRKPNHFRDSQCNIINGLGRRRDQRFYSITNQSVYFRKDERDAIRRFRLWEANQNQEGKLYADMQGSPLKLSQDLQGIISASEEVITTKDGKRLRPDVTITVDSLWDWIGHMLRTQPILCAQKTGIEQLGYLDSLQPPAEVLSTHAARRSIHCAWHADAA